VQIHGLPLIKICTENMRTMIYAEGGEGCSVLNRHLLPRRQRSLDGHS
jgi:hypothetical protein